MIKEIAKTIELENNDVNLSSIIQKVERKIGELELKVYSEME
jgi:hypothetical protein